MPSPQERMAQSSESLEESAVAVEQSAGQLTDSADRRTELAADRTLLAAERTYAAWVRTGLTALASGVGARALLAHVISAWLVDATGGVLVAFSAFCFLAAVWREIGTPVAPPKPRARRMPRGLLLAMNGFLVLVSLAALVGVVFGAGKVQGAG
ncbi:MAG: YidH family protein [Caulobacteraceae bacterium]